MVRATIIVSSLVAMVASVAAVPRPHGGSVVGVDVDKYLGIGDIDASGVLSDVVDVGDVDVNNIAQDFEVANGLFGDLLKREEAATAPQTVRIARKAGLNGKKSMGKNKAANKKTA